MNLRIPTLGLATVLLSAGTAAAAPITNPSDARSWQGATLGTFRDLYGFTTNQDLVDADILDDGEFPETDSTGFSFAGSPCVNRGDTAGTATLVSNAMSYVTGCSGYSYDPPTWAYWCGGASFGDFAERARCIDMWWIQDGGDGVDGSGNIWDLGGPSNQVAVFPVIDHGPLPEEAIEYSVYLSNDPGATATGPDGDTQWVLAQIEKVYLEGWIDTWIADGFTTVWRLPGGQVFQYALVVAGGPSSLIHDGDDEIDGVMGLTFEGEPVCAGAGDTDGDGVCNDTDNCVDDANPTQDDADGDGIGDVCDTCYDADHDGACDHEDNCPGLANDQSDLDGDGMGDACDPCPGDADNDADSDGVCGDVDNCASDPNPEQADADGDRIGDLCDPCPYVAGSDNDGDGVCRNLDNCPDDSNAAQTDSDGDGRGDACDSCDTDPENDADGDGVCGDVDRCRGTAWPESVPTEGLGVNRWALIDGDPVFDTVLPKGKGPKRSYSLADTAGCSCSQIIAALDLGEGHEKFGCSISAMDEWVALVNGQ